MRGWEILFHPRISKDTISSDLDFPVVPPLALDFAAGLVKATSLLTPVVTNVADFLDRIIALWPTIWIWMQTLHGHIVQCRLQGLSAPPNEGHHTAVFQALQSFTNRDLPLNLVAVVERTDGIARMMAALWIEEAKDTTSTLGFRASELLSPPEPAPAINLEVLEKIVSNGKDASQGPVDLLISRIKRNLKQTHTEQDHLINDIFCFSSHLMMPVPASRTLRQDIISHPMILAITVDILALILDKKSRMNPEAYKPILVMTLRSIENLSYAIQAYKFVEQILGTTFFTLVARITSDFASQNNKEILEVFGVLFDRAIPHFAFHRSLLVTMRRNITTAQKKHRKLGDHLDRMRAHTKSVLAILKEYKRSDAFLLSCSEPQVRPSNFGLSHHV